LKDINMALIQLRDATIRIKDGLSGTAVINETTPGATDTNVDIDAVSVNRPDNGVKVPVGARFTVDTAGNVTKYTVTARTLSAGVDEIQTLTGTGASTGTVTLTLTVAPNPSLPQTTKLVVAITGIAFDAAAGAIQTAVDAAVGGVLATYVPGDIAVTGGALNTSPVTLTYSGASVASATHGIAAVGVAPYDGTVTPAVATPGEFVDQVTNVTFTPAWGTPTPADNDNITWLPIEVAVKIGDGNLTYTENKDYEYEVDRGILDTVRENDEQPMDVTIDFAYEFVSTGTGEAITPTDALKGIRGAAEFTSSSTDPCEPYAVDLEVEHNPGTCAGLVELEFTLFPDFRWDTLEFDLDEATISSTGRCNAVQPVITRVAAS
jgi:hypothetical protein